MKTRAIAAVRAGNDALASAAGETLRPLAESGTHGPLGVSGADGCAWTRLVTGRAGDGTGTGDGNGSLWSALATAGLRVRIVGAPDRLVPLATEAGVADARSAAGDRVRDTLRSGDWDHLFVFDGGDGDGLDGRVAAILEDLQDETAVLIVHIPESGDGRFLLATPAGGVGEIKCANVLDMAPTLLSLSGAGILPSMTGHNLFEGAPAAAAGAVSADEEEMIREHLRGLGYL